MQFKRGLNPKQALKIGKEAVLKKHPLLPFLDDLFPDLNIPEIEAILQRLASSEEYWEINRKRYNNVKGKTEENGTLCIKYLLICESPPVSSKYFYKQPAGELFTSVWRTFFADKPICSNSNDAYQCLADIGFLLVDSLPFPVKYLTKDRKKSAYQNMINNYLNIWEQKLNSNFTFCADLKIAFGFKLNAYAILKAAPNGIMLSGIQRPFSSRMIATDGTGYKPSSIYLAHKFGLINTFNCSNC